jgi:XTP/dITP diphosphohydrolase
MDKFTTAFIMIKKLVFATHNKHKAEEVSELLSGQYEVLTLDDIGCKTEIPETGDTFAANALLKSTFVVKNYQLDCFADDSGLEVEALNNEPGIYSARYAGGKDDAKNLELVLEKMQGRSNRRARFRTVISLIQNKENYFFEGVIKGTLRGMAILSRK